MVAVIAVIAFYENKFQFMGPMLTSQARRKVWTSGGLVVLWWV